MTDLGKGFASHWSRLCREGGSTTTGHFTETEGEH